jgi:glycosyltransferase involved in cell wall biosynthesis
MSGGAITAMAVVIPVHNERALLARCLAALERAVSESPLPCAVRVVLDACTDGSAEIAAQFPFPMVRIQANAVGAARRAGVDSALEGLGAWPADRVWIANTDADSAVPARWLSTQRDLADRGADVVLGTVRPDFDDLSEAHRRHWLRSHTRGAPAGNTHGANLGVRASAYLAAGGFPHLVSDEDVQLVEACKRNGAVVVASDRAEVLTSGRTVGRAPGGYADFVRMTAAGFASGGA